MHAINLADVARYEALMADAAFTETAAPLVRSNAADVLRELAIMQDHKARDPQAWARQCLIFAILSPQLQFKHNVALTRTLYTALDNLHTLADVQARMFVTTTTGGQARMNGWRSKARYIHESLPFIRDVTPADMTKDGLTAARDDGRLLGIGEKAMSMAVALYDAEAPVYTLDSWMLRFIRSVAGDDATGESPTITKAAYRRLEAAFVAWATRTFPTLPVFLTQWAIWNGSAYGRHVSHLPIFGLTVS